LTLGYQNGSTHVFRQRCQIVLLKADGHTYEDICGILNICMTAAKNWVNRYEKYGVEGLQTRPGRGPKPKLSREKDGPALIDAVKQNRQSLKAAKAAYEAQRGAAAVQVSEQTLRRFLKALTADIKE
jgi:transposase